jgi:lipoprotein signal peptidase
MTAFVLGLIGVPLLDHAVKLLVRARLRHRSISLGPVGAIRVTPAPIWLMRRGGRWTPGAMWVLWILAAGALVIVCGRVPSLALPFGLILGGSLSHAVEISVRGFISDYICLRFWPSFDLADVALTVGAITIVLEIAAISGAWR